MTLPDAMPVTKPVLLTVAINGLLVLHVPPGVELVNWVVVPTQVEPLPALAETLGKASTLIVAETEPAAQPFGAIEE